MILVRNVFQLKFGKAKEAVALMKENLAIQKRNGMSHPTRLMTDLTGPFYTIVLELAPPDLATLEKDMPKHMADKDFQANYQKFAALVERGYREIFTIVE